MLRTRSGESVKLVSLLDEAEERALSEVKGRFPDLEPEARRRVARQVGVGAIKYVDLSSDRIKDYVFDWERMLAFEGNTGGYLQYAHARICSIFRKAGRPLGSEQPSGAELELEDASERALALELFGLAPTLQDTAATLAPHKLCGYLYGLATTFSSFYDRCPVLQAETASRRESRLLLCSTTRRALALGLELLGIEAPDRM
jgi:arginyl-tRNA synthetase